MVSEESLYVDVFLMQLLFQSQNPGIKLEYTIPTENMTEKRQPEFHWKYSDWTHCTLSCGGGRLVMYKIRFFMLKYFMKYFRI